MSDLSPALTEDMVERATEAVMHTASDVLDAREIAKAALEAALGTRVVLDLPEPEMYGSQPFWPTPMGGYVSAASATTVLVTEGYYPVEWVKRDCAARLAAAREARRLAAEAGGQPAHG